METVTEPDDDCHNEDERECEPSARERDETISDGDSQLSDTVHIYMITIGSTIASFIEDVIPGIRHHQSCDGAGI